MLPEAINLHVSSVRALSRRDYPHRGRAAFLLFVHMAAYLGAVFVLPPAKAVVFVAVHQGLFGGIPASGSAGPPGANLPCVRG